MCVCVRARAFVCVYVSVHDAREGAEILVLINGAFAVT